jgi:hypothetical protein
MTMRTTALALLAALALLVAGCGGGSQKNDRSIPAGIATTLGHRLDVIQSQFSSGGGACTDILNKTRPVVQADLQRLPSSVDPKVRDALRQSFDHLFQLAESQCQNNTNTDTQPTDTGPTPTDTGPAPTDTGPTPTDTGPTPTGTQPTTPDNVPPGQQKPKKQKNNGNGNGNGTGNGGGAAAPGGA